MRYDAFVGGSNTNQSLTVDQERTVNMYLEQAQSPGSTTGAALYPSPGVEVIAELTVAGGGRAHYFDGANRFPGSTVALGREFAIVGQSLVEVFEDGTFQGHGTLADDGLPSTISSNGDGGGQLFITSGTNGYIFTLATNVLSQVVALNGRANFGAYLEGYFLALDANSSTLLISNLLNGLTWNTGTDFAQRTLGSDPWVSMKVLNRYIYLFGSMTSEVWYNVAASFPFAPHPSGLLQYGCIAPFSVKVCDNAILWLGVNASGYGLVLQTAGFNPEIVSSYAFQKAIETYVNVAQPTFLTISDAQGDTYQDLGHTFYVLNFVNAEATWCYDLMTGIWHERGTWVPEENRFVAWRPRWYVQAFGQNRILHSAADFVFRLSSNLASDASPTDRGGDPIRRVRRAPTLVDENKRISYGALEVDLQPGLGNTTDPGSNPQVMMRFSNDSGRTWSQERWMSAGKIGEYGFRVKFNRCGQGRRRVFEITFAELTPLRIGGAWLHDVQGEDGQEPRISKASRQQVA